MLSIAVYDPSALPAVHGLSTITTDLTAHAISMRLFASAYNVHCNFPCEIPSHPGRCGADRATEEFLLK
jgi:hypothetical protein